MLVPEWWVIISAIFICINIVWTFVLILGLLALYKKAMPVLTEARTQLRRVSNQAKSVALKASNTAEIVHAQTQHLLGTAQSTGTQVTQSARAIGAAVTGLMIAARVFNFIRKVF
ncbi:MAG TPA: hypothetical protein VFB38_01830 [Chthonomonadaceae bacterium]|nr:hypothetical protein [Chthonomonadaceae bacterium]